MKYLLVNVVCGIRSTGRICTDLALKLEELGHDVKIAYGREEVPDKYKRFAYRIGTDKDIKLHALGARLFDGAGLGSKNATKEFIKWVKMYNPDVIYLHNIHGYYLNYELLFNYLKRSNKKIFWSLYDCWSFTGHCAHFDFNGCDKWKEQCENCKYIFEYPKSYISRSGSNFLKKKELFTDVPNLTIITPSKWLNKLVKKSYLKNYPIEVFPNGIDISKFKEVTNFSKSKYSVPENKFLILGVSSRWSKEKGVDFMFDLANRIGEDCSLVLVGKIDMKTKIPQNVIHIKETHNFEELCEIYSMSDVFINSTLQETQGLTTIEAMACGTPCIVFNSGGAPECIDDETGFVVEKNDMESVLKHIDSIKRKDVIFNKYKLLMKAKMYDIDKIYKPIMSLLLQEEFIHE